MNTAARFSAKFPRFWADIKSPDFARFDLARAIAVLPVAAIEQHGPHLPLDVDRVLVDGLIASATLHLPAELPVLFLPTQPVGLSLEHARFAGTLTLKAGTLISLWTELGESVAASGIKKLVLLNSHGGQAGLLDIVARDLRARLDMLEYGVNSVNLPLGSGLDESVAKLFSTHEHRFGIHAGDIETSMMLALKPEQVDMARAEDFHSTSQDRAEKFRILGDGRSAKLGWQMQDYNPKGAAGNAAAATAGKGRALLREMGRSLAQLLMEIDQLPANTLRNDTAS